MIKAIAVICIIFTFFLTGCAPATFSEMKKKESINKASFITHENYETIYKRSLSKSKECFEMGAITTAFIADGQLYSNTKEAEVTVSIMGGFGRNLIHGATFKSINENQTEVTLYTYWSEQYIVKMKKLFTGETNSCEN